MMGIIGFSVGFVGFLLHQFIDLISNTKWDHATEYIEVRKVLFISLIFFQLLYSHFFSNN